MNKASRISLAIIILSAIAGIIHTAVVYSLILRDEFTSFPASAAFLLLIPYACVITVCSVILAIVVYKERQKNAVD